MSTKRQATKSSPAVESLPDEDDDFPQPPKKSNNKSYNPRTWMENQARQASFPSPTEGELKPATLFKGLDPFVIHVCAECRSFNSKRDTQELAPGMIQLPLALCVICRAHFVQSRSRKFYDYDIVLLKKKLENDQQSK
ncbi:hypothetical protein GCK72_013062 [Caenorhabditis remanei]|uniref:Uncharacterized protein n=1 Tax=Caenorhabditis remanei TaxID=31234 RepID=A0A6A5GQ62_CAERE|nr:hypothetical protein GCK72_013062 [Caenorhabditis remanei]KAF1756609.1 hypothetical protein GCK72_013062 [Caenorhabditis remanei]